MDKDRFIAHGFSKGEAVLYKGRPAEVISAAVTGGRRRAVITVAYQGDKGGRDYAVAIPDDIEIPEDAQ